MSGTGIVSVVSDFFARYDRAILNLPSGAFGGRPGDVAMRLTGHSARRGFVEFQFDIGMRMQATGEARAVLKKEEFINIELLEIVEFDLLVVDWSGRRAEFDEGAVQFVVQSMEHRNAALRTSP